MQPDRPQPALTRATAPTAFALRNIADRKARGRLRAAATVEAFGNEVAWVDAEGWRYQLEAPPRVTIAAKDIERAAATVDLKVWDATNTLIFRDRIHAWDGFPVLVPDGTEHEEDGSSGKVRVSNFREAPLEAARSDLTHTVRVVTKNGPWVKAKPGTVSTFYSNANDDGVRSRDATYATARAGTGTLSLRGSTFATNPIYWADFTGTYEIQQPFFDFDTSAIDDAETVSAAVLSLWGTTKLEADAWGSIYARAHDFGAAVDTGDYRATDGTSAGDTLLATITRAAFGTGAYNDFTSESGFPAAINKTGSTRLYCLISNAESASAPTGSTGAIVSTADEASTTQDPKLVVTHASATKPFRRALLGVGF